jgi:hypothetical protein
LIVRVCRATKVIGAFSQMDHLRRRTDRRAVAGETRSGRDVAGHLPSQVELVVGDLREQRDDQVLQRDHANSKLGQFDRRRCGLEDRPRLVT